MPAGYLVNRQKAELTSVCILATALAVYTSTTPLYVRLATYAHGSPVCPPVCLTSCLTPPPNTHTYALILFQVGFDELEKWALSNPDPGADMTSGRQELAEIYLDMHIK